MRIVLLIALMVSVTAIDAQTFIPGSFVDNSYRGSLANRIALKDSGATKKWFVSTYSGISTSFSFFKGGNATIVSAPLGLQLNRRLSNNVYAFAGVSVAPAYVSFNSSFMAADYNKANQNNAFLKSNNLGVFSRAELGLQYVNDERTFSISGSVGVQRNTHPMMMPYNQMMQTRHDAFIPSNR